MYCSLSRIDIGNTLPSFLNNTVQYDEFAHKNTNAAKPLPFVGNVLL